MKIEFWLDYLCPKCYLQHQILENLIKNYDIQNLEIIYRSYEMVEEEDFDPSDSYEMFIAKHKHVPVEEVKAFLKEHNFNLKLFRIHDVHRLSHLAKKHKKSTIYNHHVFKAIYEDGLDLSDHENLKEVAMKAGLQASEIVEVLNSDMYHSQVISNRENAQLKGIYELPFLRVNGKIKLEDLQREPNIIKSLNQAFNQFRDIEFCEGENCIRKRRH